ncbi:transposase family protein [Halonatronum saccharophilum]|uniref:transposase family protein n=1 Tax=Halonatronum saccharophilum TaxID=150060 RepID=UPI0004851512|nr:transposase family protein [Halonatronum saccharophilum]
MQNNNITNFLQLPDLDVINLIQTEGLYIFIAQAKDKSVKCPDCSSTTDKLHDQRWQSIKDIPIRDNMVVIRLNKKRYRCNCCGKRGINEHYDSIDSYSRKTKRYDTYLTNETISKNYTTVAKENNLSYTSIDNAVKKQVNPMIEEKTSKLKNAKSISLDEFSVLKKKKYTLVICDPISHELIDILPQRNKENIIE